MVNICVCLSTDSSWRNWGSERQHDLIQLSITCLSLTPTPVLCVCMHECVCACAHMCVIYMYFYLSTCESQRTLPNVLPLPAHLFLLRTEFLTECGDRVGTSTLQRISCLCPPLHANTGVTGTLVLMSAGDQNSDPCFWTTSAVAHWAISPAPPNLF